jgi:hypothetical protein
MAEYVIIDADTIKKITEEVIDLKPLRKRLNAIEDELKIVSKEPEKIIMPNIEKMVMIDQLNEEKKAIEAKLKIDG